MKWKPQHIMQLHQLQSNGELPVTAYFQLDASWFELLGCTYIAADMMLLFRVGHRTSQMEQPGQSCVALSRMGVSCRASAIESAALFVKIESPLNVAVSCDR